MVPLEILQNLILAWCGVLTKTAIVTIPVAGALFILFIIFTDKFLSQHVTLVLASSCLLAVACFLLTLSKICILQRKSHAKDKPVNELWDTDLKYENESEDAPRYQLSYHWKDIGTTLKNFIYKNPYEFCKFRPAYGITLVTGLILLVIFVAGMTRYEKPGDDLYSVAAEIMLPMMLQISLVYYLANSGNYIAKKCDDLYYPFDEYVQIPMKFVVSKTVAIFITGGGTHWFLVIFMLSTITLCFVSSNYLYHASEMEDILKSILPAIYPGPRRLLSTILIIVIVACVNALIGMIVASYLQARKRFLYIMEKNWQRNLGAISFLLQDTEAETLKDLKTALDHKRNQQLTEKEVKAFHYISWPIWRTKQPFMLRHFAPESESSDGQPGDNALPEDNQQSDSPDESREIEQGDQATTHEGMQSTSSENLGTTMSEQSELRQKPSTSSATQESRLLEEPSTSTQKSRFLEEPSTSTQESRLPGESSTSSITQELRVPEELSFSAVKLKTSLKPFYDKAFSNSTRAFRKKQYTRY